MGQHTIKEESKAKEEEVKKEEMKNKGEKRKSEEVNEPRRDPRQIPH